MTIINDIMKPISAAGLTIMKIGALIAVGAGNPRTTRVTYTRAGRAERGAAATAAEPEPVARQRNGGGGPPSALPRGGWGGSPATPSGAHEKEV